MTAKSEYSIEQIILDEKFDKLPYQGPLSEEDRKMAIEYYKMFKDFGVHVVHMPYAELKNFLRFIYGLEAEDLAKAKKDGVREVNRDAKYYRIMLEDKYYLEECLRQTNNCRKETPMLQMLWDIKKEYSNLLGLVDIVHAEYKGCKPAGALQTIKVGLDEYTKISRPAHTGHSIFGNDNALSVEWCKLSHKTVMETAIIEHYANHDIRFKTCADTIVNLYKELCHTIKPYYMPILKASRMHTVTVEGRVTKLEIMTSPQPKVNKSAPYGWYVLSLNPESQEWEYTSIYGWECTTIRCMEAYYRELYRAYLSAQLNMTKQ